MAETRATTAARPADEWSDDDGPVLWWTFPVEEPPYVGTPGDSGWPGDGVFTHWTPIPVPDDPEDGLRRLTRFTDREREALREWVWIGMHDHAGDLRRCIEMTRSGMHPSPQDLDFWLGRVETLLNDIQTIGGFVTRAYEANVDVPLPGEVTTDG
jgi:hypothetical protein